MQDEIDIWSKSCFTRSAYWRVSHPPPAFDASGGIGESPKPGRVYQHDAVLIREEFSEGSKSVEGSPPAMEHHDCRTRESQGHGVNVGLKRGFCSGGNHSDHSG